jgi:septum formation protein
MDIILASTSLYRRRLLERLQIPFCCISPQADETPLAGETPSELALRLALTKARSVARLHPDAVVIGSDQVATIEGHIIGKPGSFETAKKQLQDSSGRDIHFYTAVSIVLQGQHLERFHVEQTTAHFRTLNDTQIEDYLNKEQPYDCAGSFKIEGLGITLFEGITGNDPTALEGLPLIKLTELLGEAGVGILQSQAS